MQRTVLQPPSMGVPSAPYVPGVKCGALIFTAGQVAYDRQGNVVGKGDVKAQTRQTLENLKAVLEEGGARLADVMKTTVYLADKGYFEAMNEVYREFFGDRKPARTTVEARLVRPELLVEIEAVAMLAD